MQGAAFNPVTGEACRRAFGEMFQARREGYAAGRRDAEAGRKCDIPQGEPDAYADAYLLGYAENWK